MEAAKNLVNQNENSRWSYLYVASNCDWSFFFLLNPEQIHLFTV